MQTNSSTKRAEIRNTLLANGYTPLPLADKGVFIQGWSHDEITEDWLARFARNGRYKNTGIRCDNLLAFDIDVLDEELADECERIVEEHCGETDFCRVGRWPKRLLLYRLDGDPDKSGRTGNYGGHMVELLATHGRQFAAFGKHPGTGEAYEWLDDVSPLTAPWKKLPKLTAETALQCLEALDEFLESTGLERVRAGHLRNGTGRNEYDLLPETKVQVEGSVVTWGELRDTLDEEGVFGNLWRDEYDDWGDSDAVHFYLSFGNGQPCAHDFVNDTTHWESTWRPELGELLPDAPAPADDLFVPDDMADMIGNCVMLKDKTVRRLDRPTRVYPLDGFIKNNQHLQVRDPNPPKSNPNKMIPFTTVWQKDPKTHRADYAAMRPDRKDERIIADGPERIMNTYLPKQHPATGGSLDVWFAFMEHLLPAENERGIFLDWLAHKYVNPGHRMHGLVMVTPAFGTGRGTVVQVMELLFGHEYVHGVELHDLIGFGGQSSYNSYLADSLIVNVDEAREDRPEMSRWAMRHAAYERIKVVCDPVARKMHIRRKYGTNSSEFVYASLFIQTNHNDALAIEPGDRRLIVLSNCETPLHQTELYDPVMAWKDDQDNIGALARWLEQRASVSEYNPFTAPPITPAKELMIEEGQSDTDRMFDAFIDDMKGAIVTPAQWRAYAYAARLAADFDLPTGDKLDAALTAVISRRGRRLEKLPRGGQIKVKGRPCRPWIIRDFEVWKGNTDMERIRAEILKNGDPGGEVVSFPGSGV